MPKWHRTEQMTGYAPDGAEIRVLVDRPQGATRVSLAEALVPVGQRTAKVYHQTVYEPDRLRGSLVLCAGRRHRSPPQSCAG